MSLIQVCSLFVRIINRKELLLRHPEMNIQSRLIITCPVITRIVYDAVGRASYFSAVRGNIC